MLKRAVRLLFSKSCTGQRSAAAEAAAGLAQLTRHLADLRTLSREQCRLCRQCDDSLARIEDAAGCAWDERTLLRSDYSRLLRGILNVLDDWPTGAANGASHEVVFEAAVKWQEDAVNAAPPEMRESFAARLALYRNRRPYDISKVRPQ